MLLKNPKCKTCNSTPVVKSTTHLHLDLPKIAPRLEKWIDESSVKGAWDANALQVARSWIKEGLRPYCITRDLKWGVPVPYKGYENKVFYVWFDAPIGYISITGSYTNDWEKWWKNPNDVELVSVNTLNFAVTCLLVSINSWEKTTFVSTQLCFLLLYWVQMKRIGLYYII